MSKKSVARRAIDPRFAAQDVVDAIALRIRQIAAAAGVIAEHQDEALSHALYLIEECLLEVEDRVEALRSGIFRRPA
jgi:hypothetical protein